jgi:transposase
MAALKKIGGKKFAIPPRSPDLNPIENIFHLVRRQLRYEAMETPNTPGNLGRIH